MTKREFRRPLVERLEDKRSPASLLLILAPAAEQVHEAIESQPERLTTDASTNWSFHHPTRQLLSFVEAETQLSRPPCQGGELPTPEQCRCADEMMKLQDEELRALVLTALLQPIHPS